MLIKIFISFLFIFKIISSYKSNPTQYICIESINGTTTTQTLPSCLPGYVLDIENVIYESTTDDTCSGLTKCQFTNKNTFVFACNKKRACQIDINNLRFQINSTCGLTRRFFVQYRCLPVIQEQKDFLCESSQRRLGDIKLSCMNNYRLHIKNALIGISFKTQDDLTSKNRFKCNKDTQTTCNTYVPNGYRDICDSQSKYDCKITYNQRPMLRDCPYGTISNFSLVEYLCIPDDTIQDDLPRIDICSEDIGDRIPTDRGLLHSPDYPQGLKQYLTCKKELYIPRESRIRLYMLEKSLEYSHELNIYLLNNLRTLSSNELLDINLTNPHQDEMIKFELKTNHVGGGQFLLYFQIDSRLSEYAPLILEPNKKSDADNRRGKFGLNRFWGIILGIILGLVLLLLLIIAIIFIAKRRRHPRRYMRPDDDHRHHLKPADHQHRNEKNLDIEPTYLASSSPTILPTSSIPNNNNSNRPHSTASSTTSSIIMQPVHENNLSDRESLIKPIDQLQSHQNKDIDNFYEEIKEQQQQTALALGRNRFQNDLNNIYLEPNKILFQGQQSTTVQPIRDHNENEERYQHPPTINPIYKKPPAPKPPVQPSAPPFQ